MADDLGIGISASDISNTVGDIGTALLWLFIVIIIGLVIWGVWWLLSYRKKKVILYEKMSNGIRMRTYRAKEFHDNDGVTKWKVFGVWKTTPEPPGKSVYPDEKGRLTAQGLYVDGTIVWLDELRVDISPEGLKSINFDPFKSEDKATLVQEFKAAENYKKRKISDLLIAAAPYLAVIIIVVTFMIFFGEVVQPTVQISNQNVVILQQIGNLTEKLDVLINNRQVLHGAGIVGNNSVMPLG